MKKLLAILLVLCMALSLAACGQKAETNSAAADPTEGTQGQIGDQDNLSNVEDADNSYIRPQITVAWATATSLTNWGTNNDTPGNYEVYEMLYEVDVDGQVYPLLADATYDGTYWPGCDHEEGSNVYTVKIYDYIHDHKGRPVTAEDVAFSFMYQYENETTSGWGDLVSVEAADPTTVVFTFAQEQTSLGALENIFCRCFIVNQESFEESPSGLVNEMCGTGPYKFDSYESGSKLTIVRNEDYWQTNEELRRQEQQANVQTIVYQFIDESAQKVIALKSGTVDYVHEIDSESAKDFVDGAEFGDQYSVYAYESKFVYYINPNCSENSLLNDVNLRLAIFNAIDQDGLVLALGGTGTRANAYVSSYYSDYGMVDWAGIEGYNSKAAVDPALVQQYLDASSYNGEKLLLINAGVSQASAIIAAQLKAFGINVEVQDLDFSSAQAKEADPTAWDLEVGMMAGDYNVTVWQHGFSFANTAEGNRAANFSTDKAWDDLLNLVCTGDGHTSENMEAWWRMAVDNAYTMGLYTGSIFDIVPEDTTYVCLGDKQCPLPGANTYAAPEA